MAKPVDVGIIGMAAIRKDMARMLEDTGPFNAALKAAGKSVADPLAAAIVAALPRRTGRLAGTVRSSGTRTGATVREGTKAVNYAGPVDFGGWPHPRAYVPGGRYMYPLAKQYAPGAAVKYAAAVTKVLEDFGWTNTTTDGAAIHD